MLRPYLVATYSNGAWSLDVELPEDWRQAPAIDLEKDGLWRRFPADGRLPLLSARGVLRVRHNGQVAALLDLTKSGPLTEVFALGDLSTPALGQSLRLQKQLVHGQSGVLFVPQGWSLASGGQGSEEVSAPQSYTALLLDGSPLDLRDDQGRTRPITQHSLPGFVLEGQQIPQSLTAPEPPIFFRDPPLLRRRDPAAQTALGEAELWPLGRLQVEDPALRGEEPLPVRSSGRYRLLLHDRDQGLLAEFPFVYLQEVTDCEVSADLLAFAPPAPGRPYLEGSLHLSLRGQPGVEILAEPATVRPRPLGAEIVPGPRARDLQLELRSGGHSLAFRLHLPHALWCLGRRGVPQQPASFGSELLDLQPQQSYGREDCIYVRLPRALLLPEVSLEIGALQAAANRLHYRIPRRGDLEIPLREVGTAIAAAKGGSLLTLALADRRGEDLRFAIARVAEAPPADLYCSVCRSDPPRSPEELAERSRCCLSCNDLYHPQDAPQLYACRRRVWQQLGGLGRLTEDAFQRQRGAFACAQWRGEYPGELYTPQSLPWPPGQSLRYQGLKTTAAGLQAGLLQLRLPPGPSAQESIWLCAFHGNQLLEEDKNDA